ncbi:uncharacterized mitochondrial protein AtMg00810-like [Nicotiana tomentosiformis]|uniref:uncharacterized mitochondrial protein AtMg00810-like n=1 Tax=Nicotiana tomentosiformis TaxID=4098 RepID=UPI000878E5C5
MASSRPLDRFSKLSEALLNKGYIPSKNDYSLFLKSTGSSLTVLAVYVDDILLAGDDVSELDDVKAFLDAQFKINDLGSIHYFLGLEVTKVAAVFLMTQYRFTSDLLSEFHCQNFSSVITPLDGSVKLSTDMGEPLSDPSIYRRIVGKLNFLQHIRPDIAFSVQHLSQFLQAPQVPHILVAIHVLRYLSATPAMGILLSPDADFTLKAYSDSDWAACAMSRKSVSGYFITLDGCPVSWKSKKQQTVSLSSVKAKCRAIRQVVVEMSWLIRLLADLVSLFLIMFLFFATTRLPYTLLRTQSFMSAPTTSRLTVIMCATMLLLVWSPFIMLQVLCNWLIS